MRRGRRPSSHFPDVPRADLPFVCFSCLSVVERRNRGPESVRELSFSFGPGADRYLPKNAVHATVSPPPRRRAGKRGRNNIHAVSPKCSRRRFTHGIHEIARVSAKPNTIPHVHEGQTLSSAGNETTPGLKDHPCCK